MHLTAEEEALLRGDKSEAQKKAMEILAALGKIYDADNLIPISSAQVSGVSYQTIGDAGLEFLEDFAANGAKASVPSYLNPLGMDRARWKEMGVPADFAKKQLKILAAYEKMGISSTCTCAPYQIGIRPERGEHIAWAESSALSFANSMLGARTNRESAVSALASAIIGKTPNYGLHLDENRVARLVVEVKADLKTSTDFGALGLLAGELSKGAIPAFKGIPPSAATEDHMKSLGAAMAASGSVPLYFAEGITPEWNVSIFSSEKVTVTADQIREKKAAMNTAGESKLGLVTLGCPHASLAEIKEVARILDGRKLSIPLWVCTSRETRAKAEKSGFVKTIEKAGGLVVADTCMVVSPLEEMGFKATGANSGKAAAYLPPFCGQKVKFADIKELVE